MDNLIKFDGNLFTIDFREDLGISEMNRELNWFIFELLIQLIKKRYYVSERKCSRRSSMCCLPYCLF